MQRLPRAEACAAVLLVACATSTAERRIESVSSIQGRWQQTHAGCRGQRRVTEAPQTTLTISGDRVTFSAFWACRHTISEIPLKLDESGRLLLEFRLGTHHCTPAECALSLGVVEGTQRLRSGCAAEDEMAMLYEMTITDGGKTLVLNIAGMDRCALFLQKR